MDTSVFSHFLRLFSLIRRWKKPGMYCALEVTNFNCFGLFLLLFFFQCNKRGELNVQYTRLQDLWLHIISMSYFSLKQKDFLCFGSCSRWPKNISLFNVTLEGHICYVKIRNEDEYLIFILTSSWILMNLVIPTLIFEHN